MATQPACSWSNDILKETFQNLHQTVIDHVNADDVCHHMFFAKILTAHDLEDLDGETIRRRKTQRLLLLLHLSKEPRTFIELRRALLSSGNENKYSWLVADVDKHCEHQTKADRRHDDSNKAPVYAEVNKNPRIQAGKRQSYGETSAGASVGFGGDDLTEILECQICKEVYDDPRVLPCGHTFCMKCISASISEYDGYATFEQKKIADEFECTLCSRSFNFYKPDLENLPGNVMAQRLIALKMKPSIINPTLRRAAQLRSIKRDSPKEPGNMTLPSHRCSVMHPTEPLQMYCNQCSEFACIKCFVNVHNGHPCSTADEMADKFKQQLAVNIDRMDKSSKGCEQLANEICNKKDRFNGVVKYIRQRTNSLAQQLHDVISDATKLAMDGLTEYENSHLDEISKIKDEVEARKSLIENSIAMSREILKCDSSIYMAQHLQQIENETEKLLDLQQIQQDVVKSCPLPEVPTDQPDTTALEDKIYNIFSQVIDCRELNVSPTRWKSTNRNQRASTKYKRPLPPLPTLPPRLPGTKKNFNSTSSDDYADYIYDNSSPLQIAVYENKPAVHVDSCDFDTDQRSRTVYTSLGSPSPSDEQVYMEIFTAGDAWKPESADTHTPSSSLSTSEVDPKHFIHTRKRTTSIALLGKKLYVSHEKCFSILVYTTDHFKQWKEIPLERHFVYPFGMAACVTNNCLYIGDKTKWSKAVYRVNLNSSTETTKWWKATSSPVGISVTSTGNVIVVCDQQNSIYELDARGTAVRTIPLSDTIAEPRHALLLPNGQFVVSHSGSLHRICLVSDAGLIQGTFGSTKGSPPHCLNEPRGIAIHPDGSYIFFADRNNNMVRILDKNLKECNEIWWSPDSDVKPLQGPRSVCYDEEHNRLYVANWDSKGVTVIDNIPIEKVGNKSHRRLSLQEDLNV